MIWLLILSSILTIRPCDLFEIVNDDPTLFLPTKSPALEHCRYLFHSPSFKPKTSNQNVYIFSAQAGRFTSPTMEIKGEGDERPRNILEPGQLCEFAFIAAPGEKVDITFTDFDMPSFPPQCKRAYLDIVFQSNVTQFRNFVELEHENRFVCVFFVV